MPPTLFVGATIFSTRTRSSRGMSRFDIAPGSRAHERRGASLGVSRRRRRRSFYGCSSRPVSPKTVLGNVRNRKQISLSPDSRALVALFEITTSTPRGPRLPARARARRPGRSSGRRAKSFHRRATRGFSAASIERLPRREDALAIVESSTARARSSSSSRAFDPRLRVSPFTSPRARDPTGR
eukprot:31125-Pelagococcus_subviridis.AAC.39